jgi:YD repeat-containing protein
VDAGGVTTRYSTYAYDATGKAIRTEHAQTDNGAPQEKFTLNYESATQTTVVTDPVGMNEVMTFSTNLGVKSLVSKINQSDGKSVLQLFDANNNLTCRKDEENHVTTYAYSATNQRTGMTEGLTGDCTNPANVPGVSRTTTYEYLSPTLDLPRFIRRPSVAMGQTFETEMVYGDAGHPNLPTQIIQRGYTPSGTAVSRAVTLGYNAFGQVNLINGPRTDVNDVTTLEYYECTTGGACGQLKKVTNALGHITTYDLYDANGRLLQMTDPDGLRTSYTYDERGRVRFITQTPPTGTARVTEYRYTAFGEVAQAIYPDGVTLTYIYDAAHDLKIVTDNLGNRIEYKYDLKGNRIQDYIYDPNGTFVRQLDRSHDRRNRLAAVNAAGSLTQTIFDAVGNLRSETDPNNNPATLHTPDALNRLIQTLDRLDGITDYSYDVNDRLTQVTAPGATDNRATTSYEYDDLGNRLKETSPDRGTTNYAHDAAGNVTGTTDARGIATVYTYDALNRLTLIDYPGTEEDVGFTYDSGAGCSFGIGRLCRAVDESGTRRFAYDAYGNLQGETWLEITQGTNHPTAYTHDPGDRWLRLTRPGGQDTAWGRDGLGRIASVVTGSTILQSDRTYRADGLLTGGIYGNGLRDVYDYDLQGRLTQLVSAPPVGSIPADGDLNADGLIDVGDLVILVRIVHEIVTPSAEQAVRGDVHPPGAPDGVLDLRDYLRLQRMVLGWVP